MYQIKNIEKNFGQPCVAEFEKIVNRCGQRSLLFENKSEKMWPSCYDPIFLRVTKIGLCFSHLL